MSGFVLFCFLCWTSLLWCVSRLGGRISGSSLCFFIFLCYKNNFSCLHWQNNLVTCGWRYMHMCICVCVSAYMIWSIPPRSPEIKQSLRPLQCTKFSCSSGKYVKQAINTSSPKRFSVPLHLSVFLVKSMLPRGIHVSHTWLKRLASDSPAKPTSKTQSCQWAFFFPLSSSVPWDTFP